jgi:hypothetical protein
VFDAQRGRTVVVYGCLGPISGGLATFIDVRAAEWDGADWLSLPAITNVGAASQLSGQPPFPCGLALAYDRARGEVVLQVTGYASQTYTLANGAWTLRTPLVNPTIPWDATRHMFFEEHSNRVVLVAQNPPSYWEWNGQTGNWAQRFPSWFGSPMTSGSFGAIAYDPNAAAAIGLGVEAPYTTRTLRYRNGDVQSVTYVTMPSVRYRYAVAYDRVRQCFVLQGGSGYADTWEFTPGPVASYATLGTPCVGSAGQPTLTANGQVPRSGQNFLLQVSNLPWTAPIFMFLGLSDTAYAGVALPFDLGVLGAPNCSLRISGDQLSPATNVLGVGLWQLAIPNLPGVIFFNQAIVFDPQANGLGLVLSNGGRGVIGS